MKKAIIRIISLVCLLALLASVVPLSAFAASDSKYFPRYNGSSGSIVNALKAIGVDSSYSFRCRVASANGITGYRGTAHQNTTMLQLLKQGKLINPDAKVANVSTSSGSSYFPRYTGWSGSIVTALKSVGVDSSYSFRCRVASANGIAGYRGTAHQNTTMLQLLKQGKLVNPDAPVGHTHNMTAVDGCTNVKISYCACGYFEAKKQGVVQQNNALALPNNGYVISPAEIAAALAALKASAAGVASQLVSALTNPYVVIPVVVSGIALYVYANCDVQSASLVDVKLMSAEFRPRDLVDGKYYYSAIYHGKESSCVMILYNDGVTLDEAKKYMTAVATGTGILQAVINKQTIELGSVYTFQPTDARKLCEELKKTKFFKYGGDRCANEDIAYNKSQLKPTVLYYEHYHLYYDRFGAGIFNKVDECHVFFGIPFTGRNVYVA